MEPSRLGSVEAVGILVAVQLPLVTDLNCSNCQFEPIIAAMASASAGLPVAG